MMDARNAGFIMIDIVKADANIQQQNPKAVKLKKLKLSSFYLFYNIAIRMLIHFMNKH